MTKNNNDLKDPRAYDDYLSLSKASTKNYLMISELIDNSISSFENVYGEDLANWSDILRIEFGFEFKGNPSTKPKKKENYEYYEGSSLWIKDNAFGIKYEDLRNCVRLNKKRKSNSSKNAHGRGLKQCAFYFGMDLYIKTQVGNHEDTRFRKSQISIISSKVPSTTNDIIIEPYEWKDNSISFNYERGTYIKVDNIFKNKNITPSKFGDIIDALSARYGKYIESKKMVIKFKNTFKQKLTEEQEKTLTEGEVKNFVKPDFVSTVDDIWDDKVYDSIMDVKISFNKNFDKFLSKKKSNTKETYDTEVMEKTRVIFNNLMDSDSSQKFKYEMTFTYEETSIPITFFRIGLSDNFSKWRGITVYEGLRPILHGPIVSDEQSTYLKWKTSSTTTGSTENRFAGFFNIVDIDAITTKVDKSTMDMDQELQENLDTFIRSVWKTFDILENSSRKSSDTQAPNVESIKDELESRYMNNEKWGVTVSEIEVKEDVVNSVEIAYKNMKTNNVKSKDGYNVIITPHVVNDEEIESKGLILIEDIQIIKNDITVIYNPNCKLWLSANKQKDFHAQVLAPVLTQLVIFFINYICVEKNTDLSNMKDYLNNTQHKIYTEKDMPKLD